MAGPLLTYSTQSHVEKGLYLFIAIFKQANIYYKIQKWLFHTMVTFELCNCDYNDPGTFSYYYCILDIL
jgi:hypothetical protein